MTGSPVNRPDFIIIGAMKCATSTLHDQLKRHDSFFMTTPKEPNFFSDDMNYAKGTGWYASLFADAGPGQLKGEASTHYTKLPRYPETVQRMAAHCPGVKCIYMMRHPVDRLVSHYIHEWTQGVISCDIDQAVRSFPDLIAYSCYNRQIEPYLETFGPASVLPVFLERLRDRPDAELQRIFAFLQVREKPIWHADLISNVSAERLRVCGWRDALVNNAVLRALRRTLIPKRVRTAIRSLWTMKERPVLSSGTRQHVEGIFAQDLKLLGQRLGFDLDCRNFTAAVLSQKDIRWAGSSSHG